MGVRKKGRRKIVCEQKTYSFLPLTYEYRVCHKQREAIPEFNNKRQVEQISPAVSGSGNHHAEICFRAGSLGGKRFRCGKNRMERERYYGLEEFLLPKSGLTKGNRIIQ